MRGTFANIRIRNKMVAGVEGGITRYVPTGEQMPIYDAAMRYKADGTPLVVIAGKEYGTGSSRDWAAKGTNLLGVRAVIAESYERIHRSNLVGMGVLPLQFVGERARVRRQRDLHHHRRRRSEAAPGGRGQGDQGRRQRVELHRAGAGSIPPTSSNISGTAASSITCCARSRAGARPPDAGRVPRRAGRLERRTLGCRDRRLDRRRADPARLSAAVDGPADRPVGRLPVDERRRRGRLHRQRLVARRAAVGDAQRGLDDDRRRGPMADPGSQSARRPQPRDRGRA